MTFWLGMPSYAMASTPSRASGRSSTPFGLPRHSASARACGPQTLETHPVQLQWPGDGIPRPPRCTDMRQSSLHMNPSPLVTAWAFSTGGMSLSKGLLGAVEPSARRQPALRPHRLDHTTALPRASGYPLAARRAMGPPWSYSRNWRSKAGSRTPSTGASSSASKAIGRQPI